MSSLTELLEQWAALEPEMMRSAFGFEGIPADAIVLLQAGEQASTVEDGVVSAVLRAIDSHQWPYSLAGSSGFPHNAAIYPPGLGAKTTAGPNRAETLLTAYLIAADAALRASQEVTQCA